MGTGYQVVKQDVRTSIYSCTYVQVLRLCDEPLTKFELTVHHLLVRSSRSINFVALREIRSHSTRHHPCWYAGSTETDYPLPPNLAHLWCHPSLRYHTSTEGNTSTCSKAKAKFMTGLRFKKHADGGRVSHQNQQYVTRGSHPYNVTACETAAYEAHRQPC